MNSNSIVLSGTGIYIPEDSITNEELVASFNQYVDGYNKENHHQKEPLLHSSADFIVKASGITKRHVIEKLGILDSKRMRPHIKNRSNETHSLQCEMAILAAEEALKNAKISNRDIDAVIVSCSNIQRAYPALAVEIQNALNISGFGYDMNAGCASATFAIQTAMGMISHHHAKAILIVNPEICSGHINFRDRDSHFIFGDAASALIIQSIDSCRSEHPFAILGTKLKTLFSNNIRNNFGFLSPLDPKPYPDNTQLFSQQGRKVFKEVVPIVAETVQEHLSTKNIAIKSLKRLWLHQANANMNRVIATKILEREPTALEAPTILHEFGNTSSPGAVISFHKYHQDLKSGDIGLLCAFGAGYSVGNVILQKI